jgi:RNA polymerase sigma factor FliA
MILQNATNRATRPSQNAIAAAPTAPASLIRDHMPLVHRIARQVHRRLAAAMELDDLVQTGMIALIEAARSYEDRGFAFATYATIRVRGGMIDGVRRQAIVCRSAVAKRRAIDQAITALAQTHGGRPRDRDIAAALGLSLADYRLMEGAAAPIRVDSLDHAYCDHSGGFADDAERADAMLLRVEDERSVTHAINALPPRQSEILRRYFLDGDSLDRIGDSMGIGAARVCQIKKAALAQMRDTLLMRGSVTI